MQIFIIKKYGEKAHTDGRFHWLARDSFIFIHTKIGLRARTALNWDFLRESHAERVLFFLVMNALRVSVYISFNGGIGSLVIDTVGHTLSQKYHRRVIQHEAGHFLIAYLLGVLPKGYTLSSLEAFRKEGSLNVQAGTAFVDFEILEEVSLLACDSIASIIHTVNTGKVSAKTLDKFTCIALAGVASEYLLFGYSEGGLADISKLDNLLKSLGFTQKKADSQVRWAVLNTILILRRHQGARSKLADAMSMRKSVGFCIDIIEKAIDVADL
ncbi:hypothetical protein GIB67_006774 [Kingdonia uniflora]|uniref:ATP-dependent Zn protease n=1 Tax=Kingdonia uniflora TaxID=39325 RepID=A0A7J7KZZ8_9MAGN|nr:hypothetical protein GIB67_006774 [Kingdonia uniflora]